MKLIACVLSVSCFLIASSLSASADLAVTPVSPAPNTAVAPDSPFTLAVQTGPGASCVAIIGYASGRPSGRPTTLSKQVADGGGRAAWRMHSGQERSRREVRVTCTLSGERGEATWSYEVQ